MKIAIFAHDAGASDILLALLKANTSLGDFKIFCSKHSPCYKIAIKQSLSSYLCIINETKESIHQSLLSFEPTVLLYGTGWQNHFEYHALSYTKTYNIPSIAFLDHWINYRERFGYPQAHWEENLPSFIATHDEQSYNIAKSLSLPNLLSITNYSLLEQIEQYRALDIEQTDTLLFLTEPTAKVAQSIFGDEHHWGFSEKDVFNTILKYQDLFTCKNIVVRVHPSDDIKTYHTTSFNIEVSDKPLLHDIARAKVIIGVDTVALYLSFLVGKKTIAYIPSEKRDFTVPLPKANQLRTLTELDIASLEINNKNHQRFGTSFALILKNILG